MNINILLIIMAAYLLGAVPFALIIAKSHGKDLRSIGSGNLGATNLSRAVGRKWGYICFCLDVLKGLIPMLVTKRFIGAQPGNLELLLWLTAGCAAILGHIFPVYIGFKGGKGVATSFGVALGLWPYFTVCAAAIWRYVSLASVIAANAFTAIFIILIAAFENWLLINLWPLLVVSSTITMMIILRHRRNIGRIIAGTEAKIFSGHKVNKL